MKPKRCTAQYPFTGTFQNGARCTLEVGHSGNHTILPPSGMDYAPDDEPTTPAIQRTLTASRQAEIEALAEKLLLFAECGSIALFANPGNALSDDALVGRTFYLAEKWLAERDRRRAAK